MARGVSRAFVSPGETPFFTEQKGVLSTRGFGMIRLFPCDDGEEGALAVVIRIMGFGKEFCRILLFLLKILSKEVFSQRVSGSDGGPALAAFLESSPRWANACSDAGGLKAFSLVRVLPCQPADLSQPQHEAFHEASS